MIFIFPQFISKKIVLNCKKKNYYFLFVIVDPLIQAFTSESQLFLSLICVFFSFCQVVSDISQVLSDAQFIFSNNKEQDSHNTDQHHRRLIAYLIKIHKLFPLLDFS